MKMVYTSSDAMLVGFLKDLLENRGITCIIKNQYLSGAIGDLPPQECWPELWVTEDRDLEPARRLIEQTLGGPEQGASPWTCPGCGERIEAQFGRCWNCGRDRPD
jgi:hypothetical protein